MPLVNASGVKGWTPDRLPDLTGQLYVITGGNSGIGLEAAKLLAGQNADVVIAARNRAKGEQAVAEVKLCGPGAVELLELNLADMASIRAAAQSAKSRFGAITALINNAGIMQTPKQQTADGFEMQLGTNHLGHFLWTALMFERVDPWHGRVVTVSSIAHKLGRIRFDNLMFKRGYDPSAAYTQSKLANLLFALEFDRRLKAAGSKIASIACHPGYSNTALQSTGPGALLSTVYTITNALMAQPAKLGAIPTVLAAAGLEAKPGGYYGPTGLFDARGPVGDAWVERRALNQEVAGRLWDVSEELVGEEFAV